MKAKQTKEPTQFSAFSQKKKILNTNSFPGSSLSVAYVNFNMGAADQEIHTGFILLESVIDWLGKFNIISVDGL